MKSKVWRGSRIGPWPLFLPVLLVSVANAQSSSLYGSPDERRPLTLPTYSWTYQPTKEPREIKIHDLITVVVDEKSQVISEGEVDRRKKADLNMVLSDWLKLDGLDVKPAPQPNGDPTIGGSLDSKYRAEAELETRDAMKFRIASEVVDIRPNGTIVIEGHRMIRNNEEVWEMSLCGVVRPEDVLPNNTVLSENVADLRIHKREAGHIRDGYRRGWFLKWLDAYQPF
ncbi:MAG: flagellar basal body L-ring protein FlgH [Pirellulales bacterium]|nr:flagellar basal body L-ring protein FlgH [Pirellulales bacterium]